MEFIQTSRSGESGQLLIIKNVKITNLTSIPEELPELYCLEICGRSSNLSNAISHDSLAPVLMNFTSFKGLSKNLPLLKHIRIYDSNIPNFESLTAKMPLLDSITLTNCHLRSFEGFPKNIQILGLYNCTIDSFEGIEANNLNILDSSKTKIYNINTTFSSLHGISRITLHSILIEYFSKFGPFHKNANLTPKGLELLSECINREIFDQYSPIEFIRRNFSHITPPIYLENVTIDSGIKRHGVDFLIDILNESGIEFPRQNWNYDKACGEYMTEFWVYALNLEEQLFIPEKIDRLLKFYEKSPIELAIQYRSKPGSLSRPQINRLIHEANSKILPILEDDKHSNLPPNDMVIAKIIQNFSISTKNGKIML